MEPISCRLRRLSLCDGLTAVDHHRPRGQRVPCHCEVVERCVLSGLDESASVARHERASAVTHSAETLRVSEWWDRIRAVPPF